MQTQLIPYHDQDTTFEAFAALPSKHKRPVVILCHAWAGRDAFIIEKAQLMAEWGYVGFALDMYGKDILGKSMEENARLKAPFIKDRSLLQRRLLKAFEVVQGLPYADAESIAVLGFGFGGLCALDFARSGAKLKGAISVYGHFDPPDISSEKPIDTKILILHGYGDAIANIKELSDFEKKLHALKVDWQTHLFGNAVHAFANPMANSPQSGIDYDPLSSKRAWILIQNFLKEIF